MINVINNINTNLLEKSYNYKGAKKFLLIVCLGLFTLIKISLFIILKILYCFKFLIGMTEQEIDESTSDKRIFILAVILFVSSLILFFHTNSNGNPIAIIILFILVLYSRTLWVRLEQNSQDKS